MIKQMDYFNKIHNVDCLEGMKQLPDESIDLIVTDPPYRITAKGSCGSMGGYWMTKEALSGKIFEHNDTDIEDYLPEFYRLLKDGSHCYIMTNNLNLPHFMDVINKSDFHFMKLLIWDKGNKICGRYYMGCYEIIIFLRKGSDRQINDCGASDLISIPNKKTKNEDGSNIHNSEKPIELMKYLIENSSNKNDIVLDPFMGSGTTALACMECDRQYIGYELDKKYFDLINKRIEEEKNQKKSSSLF